jgi:hypothetical protein
VFTKTTAGWKQVAELKGSDTGVGDQFGSSVGISGTTAVVGAPFNSEFNSDSNGRAYVFTETTTGWTEVAELEGYQSEFFGQSARVDSSERSA